jgi:nucleoside-diphosphate-sugar epimerase
MKILLTGASGIIGRYAAEKLLNNKHQLRAMSRRPEVSSENLKIDGEIEWVEGDLLDVFDLEAAVQGVDVVVHAAGMVSFLPKDKAELYQMNHIGTSNLVNACLKEGCRLLHISSVACLSAGKPMPCEINEHQGFNPDRNTSDYAISKYLAEMEVFRGREEGLQCTILNPVIVLAPGKAEESSASLVHYGMKTRLFQPEGWLNFIDARDLAELICSKLESLNFDGSRMIVSGGCIPYSDFFRRIANHSGIRPPLFTAGPFLTSMAWRLAGILAFFTGKKPLLTRFTAASASRRTRYQSTVSESVSFPYRPLEETLEWIIAKNG